MRAGIKNPAMIIPGAIEALQSLAKASEQGGVLKKTLYLVHCGRARSMAATCASTWLPPPLCRVTRGRVAGLLYLLLAGNWPVRISDMPDHRRTASRTFSPAGFQTAFLVWRQYRNVAERVSN